MNVRNLVKNTFWRVLQWRLFNSLQPRLLRTNSFLLKGKTKNGFSLSLLVFCNYDNIVHYISRLAFSDDPKIKLLEKVSYYKMFSVIGRVKPDLVFGEFPGVIYSLLLRSFLVLPRVDFSLDISPTLEQILGNMMHLRRRSVKKIEASSYVYETTRDLAEFARFYENIYLPFAAKTAKFSFSRLVPFGVMEKWFLRGELLLVKLDGACLAGLLHHPESKDIVHCRVIAYSEGLAAQAAFYYLIQTAKKDGYKILNYGAASPFMTDGLFFYKKSLGMEIDYVDFSSVFGVKVCNFEDSAQDFLASNPFIFADSGSMTGLVTLLKPIEEANLPSICHDHYLRGLDQLMLLYPRTGKTRSEAFSSHSSVETMTAGVDSFIKLIRLANYEMGILDFKAPARKLDAAQKAC